VSGLVFGSRLDQLLTLRERVDAEIDAELARRDRAARLRESTRLAARTYDEVLEDLPAEVVRAWAREVGEPVADQGRVGRPLRAKYIEAHPEALTTIPKGTS
jgi:hypothetical protein